MIKAKPSDEVDDRNMDCFSHTFSLGVSSRLLIVLFQRVEDYVCSGRSNEHVPQSHELLFLRI